MPARKSPSPAPRGSGHKQVGAVVNAIHILRHLAEQPGPVGVVALARTLKLNPSTCFLAPVRPGDRLVAGGSVDAAGACRLWVRNQDGVEVLGGEAVTAARVVPASASV